MDERASDDIRGAEVILSETELMIILAALNEVCNGVDIDDFEFTARIGAEREEARSVLGRVESLHEELARGAG